MTGLMLGLAPAWPAYPEDSAPGPAAQETARGTAPRAGEATPVGEDASEPSAVAAAGENGSATGRGEAPGEGETKEPPRQAQASTDQDGRAAASGQQDPAQIDLEGLQQRLRKTHAAGFFTKLELRSQVNDTVDGGVWHLP